MLACTLGVGLAGASCTSSPAKRTPDPEVTTIRHIDRVEGGVASVPLAGARCQGRVGTCRCRQPGDDQEAEAPADGKKRFEIHMSAGGGEAVLESPSLGRFQAYGPQESCFYIDVPTGGQHQVSFTSRAASIDEGIAPRLRIAEYGPKGPWWYDILRVECTGPTGRCNREGIDGWAARMSGQRKRGRLEPCGSAVVTGLVWDTSGGLADRDGGLYRDLTIRFSMEVKKFATQFAPGSTECIPK